jgi:cell division protein FtsI (penicillin-binding protein 3)
MMAEQPDPGTWRRTAGSRTAVVAVLFAIWLVLILARLVQLQVYQRASFEKRAAAQQMNEMVVPAQRGEILDRHGRVLAYSVEEDTVCAEPNKIENASQVAASVCGALGDCTVAERADIGKHLSRRASFAFVRHHVTQDQARRVAALKIAGIHFMKEPRRYYPNRELAAHILGFVGDENRGLAGIEERYDSILRGRPSRIQLQMDGSKGRKPFSRIGDPPVPGATLELTIDSTLQYIAERELRAGVVENKALGGSVVIMDSNTGEILGLASAPTFNPNEYGLAPADSRRNRAVQDIYEPGSTFKLVTASAALEEKVMRPTDMIDTLGGRIAIGAKRVVREDKGHDYGTLSFTDVIVRSSNVGAIRIGFRLGTERLSRYVGLFGFGTRLSPDFPAENAGIVWQSSQWTDSALASVSMGYQIGVTPLQMASAASTVANGGELVQPRVVRAVIDAHGRTPVPRKVLRRVTSPETAAEMTAIMQAVVERGTGKNARLEEFTVAGKTGTANKVQGGQYLKHDYNVSFVGFVPSPQVALTILVVIDSPHGPNPPYGAAVSAPIFHRVADAALRYLGVQPTVNPQPPLVVTRQPPAAAMTVTGPAVPLTIIPAALPSGTGQAVLPELRGLSGREALRALARLGIVPRIAGEGVVIEQDPLPGTAVEAGGACRLALGRPNSGGRP